MIQSFGNKRTRDIFLGKTSKETRSFPPELFAVARRKLALLDYVTALQHLTIPPGNRLEALKGDYEGYHSIRINGQWRIVFQWVNETAQDVKIVDYH